LRITNQNYIRDEIKNRIEGILEKRAEKNILKYAEASNKMVKEIT
jgi:hypothetical protein